MRAIRPPSDAMDIKKAHRSAQNATHQGHLTTAEARQQRPVTAVNAGSPNGQCRALQHRPGETSPSAPGSTVKTNAIKLIAIRSRFKNQAHSFGRHSPHPIAMDEDVFRAAFMNMFNNLTPEARQRLLNTQPGAPSEAATEGRDPRLVLDSSICNVNGRRQLPERVALPTALDIRLATLDADPHSAFVGAGLDFKAAHKQVKVRPEEHGLLMFRCRSCGPAPRRARGWRGRSACAARPSPRLLCRCWGRRCWSRPGRPCSIPRSVILNADRTL